MNETNVCYFLLTLHEMNIFVLALKGSNYYKNVKKMYNFKINSKMCKWSIVTIFCTYSRGFG